MLPCVCLYGCACACACVCLCVCPSAQARGVGSHAAGVIGSCTVRRGYWELNWGYAKAQALLTAKPSLSLPCLYIDPHLTTPKLSWQRWSFLGFAYLPIIISQPEINLGNATCSMCLCPYLTSFLKCRSHCYTLLLAQILFYQWGPGQLLLLCEGLLASLFFSLSSFIE